MPVRCTHSKRNRFAAVGSRDDPARFAMSEGQEDSASKRRSRWGDRTEGDGDGDSAKKRSRWGAKDAAPVSASGSASLLVQQNPEMIKIQLRLNEIQRLQALTRFFFVKLIADQDTFIIFRYSFQLSPNLSPFLTRQTHSRSFKLNLLSAWKTAACMNVMSPTRENGCLYRVVVHRLPNLFMTEPGVAAIHATSVCESGCRKSASPLSKR